MVLPLRSSLVARWRHPLLLMAWLLRSLLAQTLIKHGCVSLSFVGQLLNNVCQLPITKWAIFSVAGWNTAKAANFLCTRQTVMRSSPGDSNPYLTSFSLPNSQLARWDRLARFQCGLWPLWEDYGTSPPRSTQLGKSTAGRPSSTLIGHSPSTWPALPSI